MTNQFDYREGDVMTRPFSDTLFSQFISNMSESIGSAYQEAMDSRRKEITRISEKFEGSNYTETAKVIKRNLEFLSGIEDTYPETQKKNVGTLSRIYNKLESMENAPIAALDDLGAALVGIHEGKQMVYEIQNIATELGDKLPGYKKMAEVTTYDFLQGRSIDMTYKSEEELQEIKESLVLDNMLRTPYQAATNGAVSDALELIYSE